MRLLHGDSAGRLVSQRVGEPVATLTALKGIPAKRANNGMLALVLADFSLWQFNEASALSGDDLVVAAPSDSGSGRWLRVPGGCELKMPIAFGTADAAILWTVPTGCLFEAREFFWDVTTGFTGGAASAIGLSSSNKNDAADYRTKGDLLGGATGDVAATLVASTGGHTRGTIGTDWDTLVKRRTVFKAGETIRFDRITSAFTAGAGFACAVGTLLRNAGA